MEIITKDIEKWNKKRDQKISNVHTDDKTITITFEDINFVITPPKSENDFYVVETQINLPWVNDINIYSLEKHPNFLELITRIAKTIKINKNTEKEQSREVFNANNHFMSLNAELDNSNNDYYKLKRHLEDLLKTSYSDSSMDTSSKVKSIFNKENVGKTIVEEYLSLYKAFKNSQRISFELVDNNVFHWRVSFKNFNNDEINKELIKINGLYNYNSIVFDIKFNSILYPNYPPIISIVRPRLANSLMHKISNMKMLQLDYWTPARTIDFIVNKLYQIIDKNAIIMETDMNDPSKYPFGAYLEIEATLMNLASYVDVVDQDIDTETYQKTKVQHALVKQHKGQKDAKGAYSKSGTGYGHSGLSAWDIDTYLKAQNEKDEQVKKLLQKILVSLDGVTADNSSVIYNIIQHSFLIPYIKSQLRGLTLLEIDKHVDVYKTIFAIIQNFANEDAIFLFGSINDSDETTLFDILCELRKVVTSAQKLSKVEPDETSMMICMLHDMIEPCYKKHLEHQKLFKSKLIKLVDLTKPSVNNNTHDSEEEKLYLKTMEDLKFDNAPIVGTNYWYQNQFDTNKSGVVKYQKRLVQEYTTLMQSLPIHHKASIFARIDPENMSAMRFLVTGPENTPYECGCFLFDMFVGNDFPQRPPGVHFLNTGGVRFNPNLYGCGKVCLSILGTYVGPTAQSAETWNADNSSFHQILVSIQCQILIDEPYYNEPGYERSYGSATGTAHSEAYNRDIRLYTMKYAILDLLQNPNNYPQFTEIIKKHFAIRKNKVLEVCKKWTDKANNDKVNKSVLNDYNTTYDKIKIALDALHVDL